MLLNWFDRSTKTHPGPVVHLSDSPRDEGKVSIVILFLLLFASFLKERSVSCYYFIPNIYPSSQNFVLFKNWNLLNEWVNEWKTYSNYSSKLNIKLRLVFSCGSLRKLSYKTTLIFRYLVLNQYYDYQNYVFLAQFWYW